MTRKMPVNGRRNSIAPPKLVQSISQYDAFVKHVSGQRWLALDTESDSLFRYVPRVCLIQITCNADPAGRRTPFGPERVVDYLIDPLQLRELSEIGDILADDSTEVILHAAENDIITLQRDFDFRLRQIYDTQLAARILGRQGVGLANVLQEEFGVFSDKKMQRTDWGKRPLTRQQLTYAQIDTHYLNALRVRQMQSLEETGRLEEARAAFRLLEKIEYRPPEPRTVWQIKQIRTVAEKDLGCAAGDMGMAREVFQEVRPAAIQSPGRENNDSFVPEASAFAGHAQGHSRAQHTADFLVWQGVAGSGPKGGANASLLSDRPRFGSWSLF